MEESAKRELQAVPAAAGAETGTGTDWDMRRRQGLPGRVPGGPALLFTDLDGTMIYSHRHSFAGEKVWVEELNGKQQAFMTAPSFAYFQTQTQRQWLSVVPLTTRTRDQAARLSGMFAALGWHTVLACNGAVKLVQGVEDLAWRRESLRLAEPDLPAMEDARRAALQLAGEEHLVASEMPFLLYLRGVDAPAALKSLRGAVEEGHIILLRDSRKVYCIPQSLHKAAAMRRYAAEAGAGLVMAAGDSVFDVPMLDAADLCFCPESLAACTACPKVIPCRDGIFADDITAGLKNIRNEDNTK